MNELPEQTHFLNEYRISLKQFLCFILLSLTLLILQISHNLFFLQVTSSSPAPGSDPKLLVWASSVISVN